MIHIAAIGPAPAGRRGPGLHRRKRAEGKKPLEAMRCLKRRISDAIYRQLRNRSACLGVDPSVTTHPASRTLAS